MKGKRCTRITRELYGHGEGHTRCVEELQILPNGLSPLSAQRLLDIDEGPLEVGDAQKHTGKMYLERKMEQIRDQGPRAASVPAAQ
jgi:hypothetical protein